MQEYEQRAEEAERSPIPVFLKIGRVIVWVVYAIVLLTAILLTLAFFLRLAGANPESGFVEWVYRSTERAMRPFRGIFPTHDINGSSVLDTSLLFAAVVYFVIALLIDILLRWFTHRLRRQERDIAQARAQADLVAQQAAAQQHAPIRRPSRRRPGSTPPSRPRPSSTPSPRRPPARSSPSRRRSSPSRARPCGPSRPRRPRRTTSRRRPRHLPPERLSGTTRRFAF